MQASKTFKKIRNWGKERGFIKYENRFSQLAKLMEESGELSKAILKNDVSEQIDAIGDCTVVLVLLSEMLGLDFETCVESAYNVIENRKGKIINGSFVKEK
jgi:NTP pyrophosphatase (non-canonical NTP hydrolase)